MREKLIELVNDARMNALWHNAKKPSEYIADMLIADGVTIPVLCKDCKHYDKNALWCNINSAQFSETHYSWHEEDFCSYGERKDNET